MSSFQCPRSGQRPEDITQDSIGLVSCLVNVVLQLKAASVTDFRARDVAYKELVASILPLLPWPLASCLSLPSFFFSDSLSFPPGIHFLPSFSQTYTNPPSAPGLAWDVNRVVEDKQVGMAVCAKTKRVWAGA